MRPSLPALLTCLALCACGWLPPKTQVPIPFQTHGDVEGAGTLVLLLPGIRGRADDFEKRGFIDRALALLPPDHAVITVDAHWGYYRKRQADRRIIEDLLARYPAKRFVLAGISLGGFGSLLVADRAPERIEGLVLMAPFLGEAEDLARLKRRGTDLRPEDGDRARALARAWALLLDPSREFPVFLGYGRDDDFRTMYDYLAEQRPTGLQWMRVDGSHRWEPWTRIWTEWLQRYAADRSGASAGRPPRDRPPLATS